MTPDCAYVLDSGRPCRCPATTGDRFCRHHTPEALAHRSQRADHPAPPPRASAAAEDFDSPWYLRAYWRSHHADIARADSSGLEDIFANVLSALQTHAISPRCAGKLLQAILDRQQKLGQDDLQSLMQYWSQHLSAPESSALSQLP